MRGLVGVKIAERRLQRADVRVIDVVVLIYVGKIPDCDRQRCGPDIAGEVGATPVDREIWTPLVKGVTVIVQVPPV